MGYDETAAEKARDEKAPTVPRTGGRTWARAVENEHGIPDAAGSPDGEHPTIVSNAETGETTIVDVGAQLADVEGRTEEAEQAIAEHQAAVPEGATEDDKAPDAVPAEEAARADTSWQ